MSSKVRVRFAPSPTGGLHLGGVRTVLYNYLFARHHGGEFVLRIEDTDQSRYVPGAEEYIYETLEWCGLVPDESPLKGGPYGPYRQSERKPMYRPYAERLVAAGQAYYAFDTPEELDAMRSELRTDANPNPQYDGQVRARMRNSLSLPPDEVQRLLDAGTPHVVRIKMPPGETVTLTDMIRGDVSFDTSTVDDKVLLKADGMPTYHLAVVVDDHLMKITHAFRGEEWLPSAPVHILLWRYLFGEDAMPQWAHLPLILGPSGKLSKRDGARYGFPVFAANWTDPKSNELTEGFRERGFLPEAFVNLLALLGWNDGTDQELFSLEELVERFSIQKVHKGGAQFNFEKAQWFNHEWIKRSSPARLLPEVKALFQSKGWDTKDDAFLETVIGLVKERCTLLADFVPQAGFFFEQPSSYDSASFIAKWTPEKAAFFERLADTFGQEPDVADADREAAFKSAAEAAAIKPGELQLPLRVMLVGGKFGPPVFTIAGLLGGAETAARIRKALAAIG
ncbi:glutamate--tRNA ligase [Flaviaesturariibacter amylovorans]|uniref:Glutamate--tRNA ligase n=1 Tax=Flaviaesturariibacter amylovorans TaxID=1084520 RepID=A0ABP8G6S8_9BACT